MKGRFIMCFIDFFNERVKKLTILDVKLVQASAMCVILIIAKVIPQIMTINIWWFIVLLILFAIRPMYVFYLKK
jgi:hypothetical protein